MRMLKVLCCAAAIAAFTTPLAEAQGGDANAALKRWLDLEADSPDGAPWLATLAQEIDRRGPPMQTPAPKKTNKNKHSPSNGKIQLGGPTADEHPNRSLPKTTDAKPVAKNNNHTAPDADDEDDPFR